MVRNSALLLFLAISSVARGQNAPADLETQARILLERWLKAQNDADFSAYKSLYAKEFRGVRRSGWRAVPLDWASWMRDRERIFRKKMIVTVEQLTVTPLPTGARVRFVQRWSSEGFADVGPKQMILGKKGAELRIIREALLESQILDSSHVGAGQDQRLSEEQQAAVRALYPEFDVATRRVGIQQVSEVQMAPLCAAQRAVLVKFNASEGELGILNGAAPAFSVVARQPVRNKQGATLRFLDMASVGLQISPKECAVRLFAVIEGSLEASFTQLLLYRVVPPHLTLVLERQIFLSAGPSSAESAANVECKKPTAQGFCDLLGETQVFHCCDCEGNGIERTIYRWKRDRYRVVRKWFEDSN